MPNFKLQGFHNKMDIYIHLYICHRSLPLLPFLEFIFSIIMSLAYICFWFVALAGLYKPYFRDGVELQKCDVCLFCHAYQPHTDR